MRAIGQLRAPQTLFSSWARLGAAVATALGHRSALGAPGAQFVPIHSIWTRECEPLEDQLWYDHEPQLRAMRIRMS